MNHVIDYMDSRTSKNVKMVKEIPEQDVIVKMNASLFEWVIENLSKNAVAVSYTHLDVYKRQLLSMMTS